MSFKMRAERTSCARHITLDWIGLEKQQDSITRGHSLKLANNRYYYDLRKFSFAPRIVNVWNSLPEIVISADTTEWTDTFKRRLDKFWWMMRVVTIIEMSWQVNEEMSRDMTGEADGKNHGVDSRDEVMHIWMSDLWFSMRRWLVGEDILYDYKVELTGVGNRSQINADETIVL